MERTQNKYIADRLREASTLLEQQGANRFRVNAYRKAASTIESLENDVSLIVTTEGIRGLTSLPGIGPMIGGAIVEMIQTGHWTQLERLRGALDPEALFSRVPGIGAKLSAHIIDELHVDSLEALERAVHDGRLSKVRGFGERRVAIVRSALAEMLGRKRWGGARTTEGHEPSVKAILDVDREYREKAEADKLPKITPRRFNPNNVAWLPVLHTQRGHWHFTVFYSNTALAHQLKRNRDWVVIYFHTDSYPEGQRTVVTETQGQMRGERVVRGRERECQEYYVPSLFGKTSVA
jgi:DNA polymerase (family X)